MKEKEIEIFCPYCSKKAIWCENKAIYGRNYGKSYMCYYCKGCDAYVGCHQNTKRPLGTMANRELRFWRMRTHASLDPLWKNGSKRRAEVYIMLNKHFGKEIHIGESDIQTCKNIISFLSTKI